MNISFWNQVRTNWQSIQTEASTSMVNLGLLRKSLQHDLGIIKEAQTSEDPEFESEIEEDFWGGL